MCMCCIFFFFQAEDGIRDYKVTGVQTCALPIYGPGPAEQNRSARTADRGRADWGRGSELDRLFSASTHYVPLGTGLARRQALGDKPASSVHCSAEIRDSCSCIVRDLEGQGTTAQT